MQSSHVLTHVQLLPLQRTCIGLEAALVNDLAPTKHSVAVAPEDKSREEEDYVHDRLVYCTAYNVTVSS